MAGCCCCYALFFFLVQIVIMLWYSLCITAIIFQGWFSLCLVLLSHNWWLIIFIVYEAWTIGLEFHADFDLVMLRSLFVFFVFSIVQPKRAEGSWNLTSFLFRGCLIMQNCCFEVSTRMKGNHRVYLLSTS